MPPPTSSPPAPSAELWANSESLALACLYHPFLVHLAAGTLPEESFAGYAADDHFFLNAFSHSYEALMILLLDPVKRDAVDSLKRAAEAEIAMHEDTTAAGPGAHRASPSPAAQAYVDFLHSQIPGHVQADVSNASGGVASSGVTSSGAASLEARLGHLSERQKRRVALRCIAAMTPCMRLYAFLGKRLAEAATAAAAVAPHFRGEADSRAAAALAGEESATVVRDRGSGLPSSLGSERGNQGEGEGNLAALLGRETSPLVKWLETYSSADFDSSAVIMENLLDDLASEELGEPTGSTASDPPSDAVKHGASSGEAQEARHEQGRGPEAGLRPKVSPGEGGVIAELHELYSSAMQHEYNFFDAQAWPLKEPDGTGQPRKVSQKQRRLLFVTDFDKTCTVEDTCAVIAGLAKPRPGSSGEGSAASLCGGTCPELTPSQQTYGGEGLNGLVTTEKRREDKLGREDEWQRKWDSLVAQLDAEYSSIMSTVRGNRSPLETPRLFDLRGLWAFLSDLSRMEQEANRRLVNSGVLQGIARDDLVAAAGRGQGRRERQGQGGGGVALAPGCEGVLSGLLSGGVPVHVLSVSWSALFVSSALAACPGDSGSANLHVHANELSFSEDDPDVADGGILPRVETPLDKGRVFLKLQKEAQLAPSREEGGLLSCYVGDSITDLLPMLLADIGVVLGTSSSLSLVASAFGVRTLPLASAPIIEVDLGISNKGALFESPDDVLGCLLACKGVIFRATGWSEVNALLGALRLVGKRQREQHLSG